MSSSSCYIKFITKSPRNYETPFLSTQRVHKTPMKTNALDNILRFLNFSFSNKQNIRVVPLNSALERLNCNGMY